jgi:hypothetical protein
MAKISKKVAAPAQEVVVAEVVVAKTVTRAPLLQARAANFAKTKVAEDQTPEAAGVVKTAKGTNEHKLRVYGYDNGEGGGKVPKEAKIALVPGVTAVPAGVTSGQWEKLQEWAGKTVQAAYDSQLISSRTVRRAYRAGAIRFAA